MMPELTKISDSMGEHYQLGGINIWPPRGTTTDWVSPMLAGRTDWRFPTLDQAADTIRAHLQPPETDR